MSLPFVGPGGHGFSLVLMIQFPKYSAFGLVLGNCIIRTKENPRPPGPPHGNVSLLSLSDFIKWEAWTLLSLSEIIHSRRRKEKSEYLA